MVSINGNQDLSSQIQLDLGSNTPIYIQIIEQIKQQVIGGSLKPGEQLPTVRALAFELRVNFNTVARAYRLLDESGIISTQKGRGTYILDTLPPQAAEKQRRQTLEALSWRYLRETLRLGFEPEEITKSLQKQVDEWKDHRDLTDH
ncbi:MAG: GntR family transcriptional regulator [Anaerolineales bacterium]|nr:GntR family transcriptional regulator [Anaerolineales bacterium]